MSGKKCVTCHEVRSLGWSRECHSCEVDAMDNMPCTGCGVIGKSIGGTAADYCQDCFNAL